MCRNTYTNVAMDCAEQCQATKLTTSHYLKKKKKKKRKSIIKKFSLH